MRKTLLASALLALAPALPAVTPAPEPEPAKVFVSAARDSEWHSYRHAYKAFRFFEPYLKNRPLIQAHMQIRPLRPDLPMDGLRIQLVGETTQVEIPVDAVGRAVLPMLKQAYEEDAVLRLNRQKGHYSFNGRYSIRERADGVYPGTELRAACEQLLSAQRESGYRLRLIGKKCAGIKFVYRLTETAPQVLRVDAAGIERALPLLDAQPFENNTMGLYKVALYRFADWPADGSIHTRSAPIAIGTLYE